MSLFQKFKWTSISIPVTIIIIIISVSLAGTGHGTYAPMACLFPYAMVIFFAEGMIGPISIAVGLIQFPVYGLITDLTKDAKWGPAIRTVVLLLHAITVALVLMAKGKAL